MLGLLAVPTRTSYCARYHWNSILTNAYNVYYVKYWFYSNILYKIGI